MGVVTWLLAAAVLVLLWAYGRWRHSYWAWRCVSTPPIMPFLGHIHSIFSGNRRLYNDKFYQKFRSEKLFGVYEFFRPSLIVTDPELIKMIIVKDFDHFVDHRVVGAQEGSIFSEMVNNKKGEEWKALRAIMTPAFTSGKMRGMFHLICEKADNLVSFSLKKAGSNTPVNMRDMFGRFTLDTIASCAFGIECNCLSDSKSVFKEQADAFFSFSATRLFRIALLLTLPKLYNFLGFKVNIPEAKFFAELSRRNMEARKTGQKRGDFLDLLLEARAAEELHPHKRVLEEKTLVAQSVLFLVAGYGPTTSTLEFTTFLLAKHPQHQQTLRRELLEGVREHGAVTYQGVMEAKFLDACLMETLRLYTPSIMTERVCTKQYRVPDSNIILRPGDLVQFPIWSLHHDPQYWPQPEEFRPQRFLPGNRGDIHSFTHMPFGMGPRNCLGMRFSLMEIKVALAHLILAADLKLAPGHEQLKLKDALFIMSPKEGVMLLLTPLKEE